MYHSQFLLNASNLKCSNSSFWIPVRASDKHIAHQEEYSDSEDEGDNRRDVHHAKEVKRSRKRAKGSATPVEKMVPNGVENAVNDNSKSSAVSNENSSKPSTSPVEDKVKPKSSTSTPKEGSPQTVASVTAEVSTEPAPEQEASRKRCSLQFIKLKMTKLSDNLVGTLSVSKCAVSNVRNKEITQICYNLYSLHFQWYGPWFKCWYPLLITSPEAAEGPPASKDGDTEEAMEVEESEAPTNTEG